MRFRTLSLVLMSALLATACTTTDTVLPQAESQFESYLRTMRFTRIVPPRSGDGAGTIISFDQKGEESIEASAAQCFTPRSVVPERYPTAAFDSEFTLTTNDTVALTLPAILKTKLDLQANLSGAGVKKVTFRLIEPSETRITRLQAAELYEALPSDSLCKKYVDADRNLVIHTVLGAKGISYSFYGSNDTKIALTADLLNVVKAEPTLVSKYQGQSSLQVTGRDIMFVGYRAWKAAEVKGLVAGGTVFEEATPDDIDRLRAAARK